LDFIDTFTNVKRAYKTKRKDDYENDAEHSYQLAITCWYLMDVLQLDYNRQKVLEYSLAHDLVEAHSGDVDSFLNNNDTAIMAKRTSEENSRHRIKQDFPEFPSLHQSIQHYELGDDIESQFVHVIDKVLPDINLFLNKNETYIQDNNVTHEAWKLWLDSKLENYPMSAELAQVMVEMEKFLLDNDYFAADES